MMITRINKKKGIEFLQGIVVIVLFIIVLAFCGHLERHYSIDAEVYKVENRIVTFKDKTENLWQYVDYNNEFIKGQKVKLSFYDNCTTNNRIDDEITKVKILLDNENS